MQGGLWTGGMAPSRQSRVFSQFSGFFLLGWTLGGSPGIFAVPPLLHELPRLESLPHPLHGHLITRRGIQPLSRLVSTENVQRKMTGTKTMRFGFHRLK
jgi:hypothetical protein